MPTTIDIESQRMLLGTTPVRKIYQGTNLLGARIAELFANGTQGVWYDPSDFSTLFQDSAGTTPVTAVEQPVGLILDKSGRGNHASQPTATSRPVLSARVNQYLATETLATQDVTTLAAQYRLSFEGTGTVTLSGTATGVYSAGSHLITCTAGTLTSTVSGSVTKADLRVANTGAGLPAYQRVNTATDYDTVGFPPYLKFDGVDDGMVTNSIDFTSTNTMTLVAGLRKLNDASALPVELSSNYNSNPGSMYISSGPDPSNGYKAAARGSAAPDASHGSAWLGSAPDTSVLAASHNIPGDNTTLRRNGVAQTPGEFDKGEGNFGNYPLYIGRRGGTSGPFNGCIYGLIVLGGLGDDAQIRRIESYVNSKTRAY